VVRRAADRGAGGGEPRDGAGEPRSIPEQQGEVVQAGVPPRGSRRPVLVQDHQLLVARPERRGPGLDVAAPLGQAERAAVEGRRALEVGHREVRRAEP
jgi:hypothetical protein